MTAYLFTILVWSYKYHTDPNVFLTDRKRTEYINHWRITADNILEAITKYYKSFRTANAVFCDRIANRVSEEWSCGMYHIEYESFILDIEKERMNE